LSRLDITAICRDTMYCEEVSNNTSCHDILEVRDITIDKQVDYLVDIIRTVVTNRHNDSDIMMYRIAIH
jgi:hypothetical protein